MPTTQEAKRVILVTGANRGIGLAIVKQLAKHPNLPPPTTTILLGCRNFNSGVRACSELQSSNITNVAPIQLDVTSDASIRTVVEQLNETYQYLDVLINNAGYAAFPASDHTDLRQIYQDVYNVNVTSIAVLTRLFLPLLRRSPHGGKVIQIGSARGSMHRNTIGALPPTVSAAYSVSKAGLNMLTVDMSRESDNEEVEFQIANPGHCKTQFNGFKGARDPEEGANVVVELVVGQRRETKMWETVGDSRELEVVPW